MKKLLIILLVILLVAIAFFGCKSKEHTVSQGSNSQALTESTPLMSEIEYMDITEMIFGELLGKSVDACGLPQDSMFLTGEYVAGFDYMCLGNINGNITCYFDENGITSYVFGSIPFDDTEDFSNAFNVVNDTVASKLGKEVAVTEYYGSSKDEDQIESVFNGSGTVKTEYFTDTATITVTGCGVNDVATIVVECSKLGMEG